MYFVDVATSLPVYSDAGFKNEIKTNMCLKDHFASDGNFVCMAKRCKRYKRYKRYE